MATMSEQRGKEAVPESERDEAVDVRPLRMAGLRTLVIGGGGAGIGRAITAAYAQEGAAVAVADRDETRADEAAAAVSAAGRGAVALVGDVRRATDVDRIVTGAAEAFGGLDVLTTVVGGQVAFVPAVRIHEMADDDWDLIHDVNLRYVFRAVRAAVRVFLDQGSEGSIVSVGSVTGFMAAPDQGAYGAAKAGLASLARTVAAEYAADRIRMNVVAAGAIATAVANPDQGTDEVDEIPLRRLGLVSDVAEAAVYLASPASAYVTGQQLVVDGGVSGRGPFS
jgi:3-oxoacyl-[acyl-carrier protein] reductase